MTTPDEARRQEMRIASLFSDGERMAAEIERLKAEVSRLSSKLLRLCDAADNVGITHFDTDDMSAEVEEMQAATLAARAVLPLPPQEAGT